MTRCYVCKGPVQDARVRIIRERNGKLFVIDNVPAQVCQQCGEEFYRGWVLEEVDRLMDSGESVEREITVPVMRFRRELAA
jgi:YgiT-type zinc finger domain-containing protein